MLVADHAQLSVGAEDVVVRLAVGVGAVHAPSHGRFAAGHAVVPGADPLLAGHFVSVKEELIFQGFFIII